MPDPRRLIVFGAVVRAGSFSAAAKELHLSQPSVSRHVAALESECGLQLLERTSRGLRLTAAGNALLDHASALRTELTAVEATLAAFALGERGRVRVAAFPTAAAALIAPALARLRRTHPAVEATLREASRTDALALLRDGNIDVAVVFSAGDETTDARTLARHDLFEEEFFVALPRSHALAARPAVSLKQLSDEGWIVGTAPRPAAIEAACLAAGFAPRIVATADDQPTIQALVASGVAVTLIPALAAESVHKGIALRPLRNERVTRRVSAFTLDVATTTPSIAAFVDQLRIVALSSAAPVRQRRLDRRS